MVRFIYIIISLLLSTLLSHVRADSVHDTSYYSPQLKRKAHYTVILPSDFTKKKAAGHRFPVLYLLHCAGCDHRSYAESYNILGLINSFDMIVAIPFDGTSGGWWIDSPLHPSSQLSEWLTGEFKSRIDSLYPTLSNRGNTGIAGHSMGGFGALHNLALHPDLFCAAFSAKGLLDMVGREGGYMSETVLGTFRKHPQNYHAVDILRNAKKYVGINAPIKFYSGPNDRFQAHNRAFDTVLTSLGVKHEYFENSEDHFSMSRKSMRIMLSFFDTLFTRKNEGP